MKLSQLMASVLALSVEQKEMFQVVLNHSLKTENQKDALIQVEMDAADSVVEQIGPLRLNGRRGMVGAPIDPNSAYSIALDIVKREEKVPQEEIVNRLMIRRHWNRMQAYSNLLNNKKRLMAAGISLSGYGPTTVWSVQ